MKPSSILLLTAAGLASALPALPLEHHVARHAPEARSLFGRAVGDVGARNPVALSANAAAPRDAGLAAGKDDADAHSLPPREAALPVRRAAVHEPCPSVNPLPPHSLPAREAAVHKPFLPPPHETALPPHRAALLLREEAVTTTSAAAIAETTAAPPEAEATTSSAEAETTTTSAAPADNAAVTTSTTDAAATNAAATTSTTSGSTTTTATTAAAATATEAVGGDGKGMGGGKGKGQSPHNSNSNNGDNGLGSTINSALSQIGLDGVLDASRINGLPVGDQISLLAQIISLQTMVDLQMVNSREVIIVLNQGFRSSGLNVVINA